MGWFDDNIKIGNTIRAGLPRPQEDDDKVSDALTSLGFPIQAPGDKPFGQIERFQEREGLKVDAIVMPQGPTLAKINERLAERRMRAENNPLAPAPTAPTTPARKPALAEPAAAPQPPPAPRPALEAANAKPGAPLANPAPRVQNTPNIRLVQAPGNRASDNDGLQRELGPGQGLFRPDNPPPHDIAPRPPEPMGPPRAPQGIDPRDGTRITDPVLYWRTRQPTLEVPNDGRRHAVVIETARGLSILALDPTRPHVILERVDDTARDGRVVRHGQVTSGDIYMVPPGDEEREFIQGRVNRGANGAPPNARDRDRLNYSPNLGQVLIRYPSGDVVPAIDVTTARRLHVAHPNDITISVEDAERVGLRRWLIPRPGQSHVDRRDQDQGLSIAENVAGTAADWLRRVPTPAGVARVVAEAIGVAVSREALRDPDAAWLRDMQRRLWTTPSR